MSRPGQAVAVLSQGRKHAAGVVVAIRNGLADIAVVVDPTLVPNNGGFCAPAVLMGIARTGEDAQLSNPQASWEPLTTELAESAEPWRPADQ